MKSPSMLKTLWLGLLLLCGLTAHAFYDPTVGRWASRDPIEEKGGVSIYAMIRNDPVHFIDYLGLCACEIKQPLTVKLTSPSSIFGNGTGIAGPSDTPVWGGQRSRIWFTMKAGFSNRCCEFRQLVKSHTRVGNSPPETDQAFGDDGYNAANDPGDYTATDSGGANFSSWDNPGWNQELQNPNNLYFSGWMIFEGYVIDVCNGGKKVGPTKHYGFMAYGTPPGIKVNTWGFDP